MDKNNIVSKVRDVMVFRERLENAAKKIVNSVSSLSSASAIESKIKKILYEAGLSKEEEAKLLDTLVKTYALDQKSLAHNNALYKLMKQNSFVKDLIVKRL